MLRIPVLPAVSAFSVALCFSLAAFAASSVPDPLPARAGHVSVDYTIAFIGIPFGHVQYDIRTAGDGYRTQSHFETSGIVSAFWQATIDATASGQFTAGRLSPAQYDSYYRRGGKPPRRVKLTYGADGMPALLAEPPYDVRKYPVTDTEKKAGADPLSAATSVLAGLRQNAASPCGTVAAVFDGRRRYNIEFTWLRDEPVKLDSGLYNGKAHLCELRYDQIAGFKPKILKEGRALPPAYAWLAEIPNANAPRARYVLPLKLWASTGFGTVTATLTRLKIEGGV